MKIRIDPLDSAFSKMIRLKHPICQGCGLKRSSQIHHYLGRRFQSVRFNETNIFAVCFPCHRKFHENPEWGREKMIERLGDKYDEFILLANNICKRTKDDKKIISIWIKSELNILEGE